MSDKQPEALRLADAMEQQFPVGTAQYYLDGEAAKEIRRQHVEIERLNAALKWEQHMRLNPATPERILCLIIILLSVIMLVVTW